MVRGLDVFREYFAGHADQFVLIGIAADHSIDPKSLKLNNTVAEIVQRIALAYELK